MSVFYVRCFIHEQPSIRLSNFLFYQLGGLTKYISLKNEPRHRGHLTQLISIHLVHMTYLGKISFLWISWF